MSRHVFLRAAAVVALATAAPAPAQPPAGALTVNAIFASGALVPEGAPDIQWMRDGRSYVQARPAAGAGTEIVRVDVTTGQATVLVPAAALVDGEGRRIVI